MAYKGQSDGGATESSGVTARPHAQAHDAFKCRFLHLQYEDERVHVMALWGAAEVMNYWVKLKASLWELTADIISIISSSSVIINGRRFRETHSEILFLEPWLFHVCLKRALFIFLFWTSLSRFHVHISTDQADGLCFLARAVYLTQSYSCTQRGLGGHADGSEQTHLLPRRKNSVHRLSWQPTLRNTDY